MPTLEIECIADHLVPLFRRGNQKQKMYALSKAKGVPKPPTISRLLSWDERLDKFTSEVVPFRRTYERANSIGSRGIYAVCELFSDTAFSEAWEITDE